MTPPDPVLPFTITWNGLLIVWQLIGAPLVGIIVLYVRSNNRQLCEINKHMAEMNGKVIKVETWMIEHEKKDDERFGGITRQFRDVRDDLRNRPSSHSGLGP